MSPGIDPRQEWSTPLNFWAYVFHRWRPSIDVCASAGNAKCGAYYTPEEDGLASPWFPAEHAVAWCNPGFSTMAPWLLKADRETQAHPGCVALVLGIYDPSTWWWDRLAASASIVYEIAPRIQYEPAPGVEKSSNTKPSALFEFCRREGETPRQRRGRIVWKDIVCPASLRSWAKSEGLE